MKRRGFLRAIFYLTLLLFGIILFYPLITYLLYKEQKTLKVTFHPDEQLLRVNFKKGAYLIKDGHGWYALSAHCTHLGCIINFDSKTGQFHCPCHGSAFDISGKRIAGPAKQALSRLPLKSMDSGNIIATVKE